MSRRLFLNLNSAVHCWVSGRAIVLFGFEGTYSFLDSKSVDESILTGLALWLNPEQLIQSGRCRAIATPI
ncbi:hypothetical protein [Nostoc sp. WHI]|uniref:hypothetical protein n=1 Tax=Nostoc sp. WHI TaxID=2650611 RepID=UPI0018C8314F|nr:hypothetical protein [Nostoc sp. WHI]MBG1266992.1 hypothetical protein [Nostoc sp. WHI]